MDYNSYYVCYLSQQYDLPSSTISCIMSSSSGVKLSFSNKCLIMPHGKLNQYGLKLQPEKVNEIVNFKGPKMRMSLNRFLGWSDLHLGMIY